MSVLVVGGGISGLVAARALARDGVSVTLVEAGAAAGRQGRHGARGRLRRRARPGLVPRHAARRRDPARELGLGDDARRARRTRARSSSATGAAWSRCPRGWASCSRPVRCRSRAPGCSRWPEKLRMAKDVVLAAHPPRPTTSRSARLLPRAPRVAARRTARRPARGRGLRDADRRAEPRRGGPARCARPSSEHRSLLFAGLADGRARCARRWPRGRRGLGVSARSCRWPGGWTCSPTRSGRRLASWARTSGPGSGCGR